MTEYFKQLRVQGQKIDEGIHKLNEVWKSPHILVRGYGGYGGNAGDAEACTKTLLETIKNTQDEMTVEEELRAKNISEMDAFLGESKNIYESMIRQCSDIESVFMDYGYMPVDKSVNETNPIVEFTPDMPCRHRSRISATNHSSAEEMQDSTISVDISHSERIQVGIATPVIKSLASVMELQTPNVKNVAHKCTPIRKCPEAPVFSSHFYNIIKK